MFGRAYFLVGLLLISSLVSANPDKVSEALKKVKCQDFLAQDIPEKPAVWAPEVPTWGSQFSTFFSNLFSLNLTQVFSGVTARSEGLAKKQEYDEKTATYNAYIATLEQKRRELLASWQGSFNKTRSEKEVTPNIQTLAVINYFEQMLSAGVASKGYLDNFIEELEKNHTLIHPLPAVAVSASTMIHRDNFEPLIRQEGLNHRHILQWAKNYSKGLLAVQDGYKTPELEQIIGPLKLELYTKGLDLINLASSVEQLNRIETFLSDQLDKANKLGARIIDKRKAASKSVRRIAQVFLRDEFKTKVEGIVAAALEKIKVSKSEDEMDSLVEEAQKEAQALIEQFTENERIRHENELRFDIDEKGNSIQILEKFLKLDQNQQQNIDRHVIASKMETNNRIKIFVYTELQLIRRLLKKADQLGDADVAKRVRAGALKRLENDKNVLIAQASTEEHLVSILSSIRQSVNVLNHTSVFKGMLKEKDLKRVNLLEREQLVTDALHSIEVRAMVLNAAFDLTMSLPPLQAPTQPSRTPPTAPHVPRRVSSRSQANRIKAEVASYRRKVNDFKASWEKYKKDAKKFKEVTVPNYRQKVADLRAAHGRRIQARQSYLAYLSIRYPDRFTNASIPQTFKTKMSQVVHRRIQVVGSQNPRIVQMQTTARERSQSSISSGFHDDFFSWYMMFYTGNPMWLFNHPAAFAMLIFDQVHFDLSRHNQQDNFLGLDTPQSLPQDLRQSYDELNNEFPAPASTPADMLIAPMNNNTPNVDNLGQGVDNIEAPVLAPELQGVNTEVPTMPDVNVPDVQVPEVQVPDVQIPDVQIPDIQIPDVQIPDIQIPDVQIPDVSIPDVKIDVPDFSGGGSSFNFDN